MIDEQDKASSGEGPMVRPALEKKKKTRTENKKSNKAGLVAISWY